MPELPALPGVTVPVVSLGARRRARRPDALLFEDEPDCESELPALDVPEPVSAPGVRERSEPARSLVLAPPGALVPPVVPLFEPLLPVPEPLVPAPEPLVPLLEPLVPVPPLRVPLVPVPVPLVPLPVPLVPVPLVPLPVPLVPLPLVPVPEPVAPVACATSTPRLACAPFESTAPG